MNKYYKTLIVVFVFLLSLISLAEAKEKPDQKWNQKEREMLEEWTSRHWSEQPIPFFSFLYDGKKSSVFIPNWKTNLAKKKIAPNKTDYTLTFTDPETELQIKCIGTSYFDFPAIEWMIEIENRGTKDTPIIENIQAADVELLQESGGKYRLHHALGSNHGENDFAPLLDEITPNNEIILAPKGGRSSDETAFP